MYRQTRNYENLQKRIYTGVGDWGVPEVRPSRLAKEDLLNKNWIGCNYMRGCDDPEEHCLHFFVDDYQFTRFWSDTDRYLPKLKRFRAVLTPDFSLYTDFPRAVQLYNHYRRHWLGAYWQEHGVEVIPTIGWSDESSYEFCFDGEPRNSIVAVSSVGTQANETSKVLFLKGFEEMQRRLNPRLIILYGDAPMEIDCDVIRVESFQKRFDALKAERMNLHATNDDKAGADKHGR